MLRKFIVTAALCLSPLALATDVANDVPSNDEAIAQASPQDFAPVRRVFRGVARVAGGVVHGTAHVVGGVVYGAGRVVGGTLRLAGRTIHGAARIATYPLRLVYHPAGYYYYAYPVEYPGYTYPVPTYTGQWHCYGYPQGVEGAVANEAFSSDYNAAYQVALNTCTAAGYQSCVASCRQE